MVDLTDPNSRLRIANMLAHGGEGRQQAVSEILKGDTGVPAFGVLAEGFRAQAAAPGERNASLNRSVPVTRIGPPSPGKAR